MLKINETYDSVTELRELAGDIIIEVAKQNVDILNKNKSFSQLFGINLKSLNNTPYVILRDFISTNNINIIFEPSGDDQYRGYYTRTKEFNPKFEREIVINYDYNSLKEDIDDLLVEKNQLNYKDLYYKIYNKLIQSLIHELQHAYDDFVSKGNAFQSKRGKKYDSKYNTILKQQSFDFEQSKDYLKLPHEIWARFSQTLNNVYFSEIDFVDDDNFIEKMRPLNTVVKEFVRKFNGYSVLTEKQKRMVVRKVSQFWHIEQENLNKKLK